MADSGHGCPRKRKKKKTAVYLSRTTVAARGSSSGLQLHFSALRTSLGAGLDLCLLWKLHVGLIFPPSLMMLPLLRRRLTQSLVVRLPSGYRGLLCYLCTISFVSLWAWPWADFITSVEHCETLWFRTFSFKTLQAA